MIRFGFSLGNMLKLSVWVSVLLLWDFSTDYVQTATKIWKHDLDILDPTNWIGGKRIQSCEGIEFPEALKSRVFIDHLETSTIELPEEGQILLAENASITFDSSQEDHKCIRLKDIVFTYWSNPSNWITEYQEQNLAIPHAERPPCTHDDVIFPHKYYEDVIFDSAQDYIKIKSLKLGNKSITKSDLTNSDPNEKYQWSNLFITQEICKDLDGCLCGNGGNLVCSYLTEEAKPLTCLDPVLPIGFCSPICGGYIHVKSRISIEKLKTAISQYPVDSYVSKVSNDRSETFLQIVFTEKTYEERSTAYLKDFYEVLRGQYNVKNVELVLSGPYFILGEGKRSALGMVLGTLFGVLLLFGLIFFVYTKDPKNFSFGIPSRLNILNSSLFSHIRFDTREEGRLFFEEQSLAGSVLGLDTSFDNPMFSQPVSPSTYDQASEEGIKVASGENPMYELNIHNGTEGNNEMQEGLIEPALEVECDELEE